MGSRVKKGAGSGNLSLRLTRWGYNLERPHHFVVFVFEDVAVPDETKPLPGRGLRSLRQIKLREDSRHHARVSLDCVLPGGTFVGIGRNRGPL